MHLKILQPINCLIAMIIGSLFPQIAYAAQVDVDSAARVCGSYYEGSYYKKWTALSPGAYFSKYHLGGIDAKSIEEARDSFNKLSRASRKNLDYLSEDIAKFGSNDHYRSQLADHQFIECMALQAAQSVSGGPLLVSNAGTGARGKPTPETQSNDQPVVEQSLALVQQNQSRGDEQARKDGRKRSNPEYEAHKCLTLVDMNNPASFGGLHNSCSYKVSFNFCVYRPKPSSWATAFDCEKQSFGGAAAGANGGKGAGHMKGGEAVHFFACREPALVLDTRFNATFGRVEGRCRVVGG